MTIEGGIVKENDILNYIMIDDSFIYVCLAHNLNEKHLYRAVTPETIKWAKK